MHLAVRLSGRTRRRLIERETVQVGRRRMDRGRGRVGPVGSEKKEQGRQAETGTRAVRGSEMEFVT